VNAIKGGVRSYDDFYKGKVAMMVVDQWEPYTSMYLSGFKDFKVAPVPLGIGQSTRYAIGDATVIKAVQVTSKFTPQEIMTIVLARDKAKFTDKSVKNMYPASAYEKFLNAAVNDQYWSTEDEAKSYWDSNQNLTATVDYWEMDTVLQKWFYQSFERIENGESVATVLESVKSPINAILKEYSTK
jgi:hypothetical protein